MSRSESHAQNIEFVSGKWEAVNNHVMGIRLVTLTTKNKLNYILGR